MSTLNLTPDVLRRLQKKELDSIVYFDRFCRENGLTYFLLGGCVIGALRHGGFIPWDDDIDVIMPRNDYRRMLRIWRDDERFRMLWPDGKTVTHNPFATLVDTSVHLVKENQKDLDIPRGIVTDIFPLDGCPDGRLRRYRQYLDAMVYSLYATEVVPVNHGKAVEIIGRLMLSLIPSRKARTRIFRRAEKRLSRYRFDTHAYCTELYAGPHYMLNRYPQEAFDKAVYHTFEGLQLPLPQGYDTYLSMAFGDYMTLPPKELQVPHHDLSELNIDQLPEL